MSIVDIQNQTDPVIDHYVEGFDRLESQASSARAAWLHPVRKAAIASFSEHGFPTIRDEEWRHTNIAPIAGRRYQRSDHAPREISAGELEPFDVPGLAGCRLVWVNGVWTPQLSTFGKLPVGTYVGSIGRAWMSHPALLKGHLAHYAGYRPHAFVALNTAFLTDGALIHLPRGADLTEPIHLMFVSAPDGQLEVSYPRVLIVAESDSQAVVIEHYVGPPGGEYLTNAVTEIVAGDGVILDHYKIQQESTSAAHMATLALRQGRGSSIRSHSIAFGGGLVRNDVQAVLDGEGAECVLNGLSVLDGRQHVDHHLVVDHAQPHGASREYYKTIADGKSHGVFSGRIIVRPGAQKTDAKQTNKNLLLSEEALVDTKPQLEIFADDVKCTHGATIGQLDTDAMFYLRSRGVTEPAARGLLTYAFAAESLQAVRVEPLRQRLAELLVSRLPQGEQLRGAL
ncbi:MAG: Fe-S cluster assembly protein SufD [Phycisphaerales bacterium]|nr:Fe-S cluster assembly protein SufD [Phycisphaerales bacterium]